MSSSQVMLEEDPAGASDGACARPVLVAYGWPRERYANGVVSYTADIVASMRRLGVQPRIAVFALDKSASGEDVSQFPVWRNEHGRCARLAVALARSVRPAWVDAQLVAASVCSELRRLQRSAGVNICEIEEAAGLVAHIAPRSPMPVVVRLHGPWLLTGAAAGVRPDRTYWARVRAEGRGIAAAHGVTAPSQAVLDAARAHYGLPLESAVVIPNPVSPATGPSWSLPQADPEGILFVGRFDRLKGGDIVIDALAHIKRVRPHCRLVFAGPDRGLLCGDGRRLSIQEYVQARLPGALADGSLEWLGFQPAEQLSALRRQARVTVVCSRFENFPMTLLEAMTLGCPVVGTQTGGIPEIIEHRRNGLLCRPDDAADLAEKLQQLLGDGALAARLGAQAAIDVDRRYRADLVATSTLSYYRRVLNACAARAGTATGRRELAAESIS